MTDGLAAFFSDPVLLAALLLAVPCGLAAGAVPGVGGKLSIVIALPFLLGVEPLAAGVFLLAMHSVIHTGGPVPSILLGVPGSGPDAATVLDGHPMCRQGQAHRALGAALGASAVGGLVGVALLAAVIPLAGHLVYFLGPPERFLLTLLGISFIASLSDGRLLRGLVSGCLGLLVTTIGMDPLSGVVRYAGDQLFLWDGVDMISAVIAVFAIPEIVQMASGRRTASEGGVLQTTRMVDGFRDVWRHRVLTLRASVLGALVGFVPGLGGEAASWMAYGHAANSSRDPQAFGKGRVEGVIAPEAANNSKEGGSLITTLLIGLPGSSGMTILLGAFLTLGILPGPAMLGEKIADTWTLVWALVLSNLLSVLVFVAGAGVLVRVTRVPARLLFPFTLALALMGGYLSSLHWQNLLVMLVLGCLGLAMKRYEWSRGPFALGLILGQPAEVALYQSMEIWGAGFLLRPASLVLLALIAASLAIGIRSTRRRGSAEAAGGIALSSGLAMLFIAACLLAPDLDSGAASMPLAAAGFGLFAVSADFLLTWKASSGKPKSASGSGRVSFRGSKAVSWLVAFTGGAVLFGISPGLPLLVGAYLLFGQRLQPWKALAASAATAVLLELLLGQALGLEMFRGLLLESVWT